MEEINTDDHAALLDLAKQLQNEKAEHVAKDLQLYLHKYQELLLDLQQTVRNYKETARRIRGEEK